MCIQPDAKHVPKLTAVDVGARILHVPHHDLWLINTANVTWLGAGRHYFAVFTGCDRWTHIRN
jgi:hypothetical protein